RHQKLELSAKKPAAQDWQRQLTNKVTGSTCRLDNVRVHLFLFFIAWEESDALPGSVGAVALDPLNRGTSRPHLLHAAAPAARRIHRLLPLHGLPGAFYGSDVSPLPLRVAQCRLCHLFLRLLGHSRRA